MSQVVNALVLPLHLAVLVRLGADTGLLGDAVSPPWVTRAGWASVALTVACIAALAWSWWR
jgi:Mn2+/Fe2+ NRAMP family transporter